jgi:hypothetical protein
MSANIDLNVDPYFDDFDKTKGFHQILFKPGFAVQARELSQMQTIIQDQIKSFGDHIFQNGTVVIPGYSAVDYSAIFLKVDTLFNNLTVNVNTFVGLEVENIHGVRASIVAASDSNNNEPKTLFIKYIRGSTDGNRVRFEAAQVITAINPISGEAYTNDSFKFTLQNIDTFSGLGTLAHVNTGVFYINGKFIYVNKQSIIISKFSDRPHCRVLLRLEESIVSADDDETLLDPASGSYNYAAPGADRLRAELILEAQGYDFLPNDNYIELMRFRDGVLEQQLRYTQYSELEKNIARRTFDESGDYIVDGFKVSINDHLLSDASPLGNWTLLQGGEDSKLALKVSPGKAYIKGFEVDKIADAYLAIDKARTDTHVKSINDFAFTTNYGQFILITELAGLPDINTYEQITFFNTSASGGGTIFGTANVRGISLYSGDPDTNNAVYALYLFNRSVPINATGVGGIRWSTGSAKIIIEYSVSNATGDFAIGEEVNFGSIRTGVVHNWNPSTFTLQLKKKTTLLGLTLALPIINDTITGAISAKNAIIRNSIDLVTKEPTSLIALPVKNVKAVFFPGSEITYEIARRLTVISTSSTTTVTISSGTLAPKSSNNTIVKSPTGNVSLSLVTFTSNNTITINTTSIGPGITLSLVVPVIITNPAKKTKTLTTGSDQFISPGVSPTVVTLTKADVTKITTVTRTVGNTDTDITSQCAISDYGQRDVFYGPARVSIPGVTAGSTVTIDYEFFAHSPGDFFSVDSYPVGTFIRPYQSTDGRIVDLEQVLDFRPIIGATPVSVQYPRDNSTILVDLQYYVGRKDSIFLELDGSVKVISGIPDETPRQPAPLSSGAMLLAMIDIPPYTKFARDVKIRTIVNRRYTMRDIGKIADRVERIEYFSNLRETEKSIIDMSIINPATGLDRFKSGYLIDGFDNSTSADIFREGFSGALQETFLTPMFEQVGAVLDYDSTVSSPNITFRGGSIMLPFESRVVISQPAASRVTNLNPFLQISWNGLLKIAPASDNWIDSVTGPEIRQAIEFNETINIPQTTIINSIDGGLLPNPSGPVTIPPILNIGQRVPVIPNTANTPLLSRLPPEPLFDFNALLEGSVISKSVMSWPANLYSAEFGIISLRNVVISTLTGDSGLTLTLVGNSFILSGTVGLVGNAAANKLLQYSISYSIAWSRGNALVDNSTDRIIIQVNKRPDLFPNQRIASGVVNGLQYWFNMRDVNGDLVTKPDILILPVSSNGVGIGNSTVSRSATPAERALILASTDLSTGNSAIQFT